MPSSDIGLVGGRKMNRITDVTRQDIIDIIRDGIWFSFDEPQYNGETGEYEDGYLVKMPIYGRLFFRETV